MIFDISSLSQLEEFSKLLCKDLVTGDVIYLQGDLGSGKTTLTQMLLKNLGYKNRVKSPTYAIYESYQFEPHSVIHMDLYRLSHPEELFYLGIEEIFNSKNIVIIEWPEKGKKVLPEATKILRFDMDEDLSRTIKIQIT